MLYCLNIGAIVGEDLFIGSKIHESNIHSFNKANVLLKAIASLYYCKEFYTFLIKSETALIDRSNLLYSALGNFILCMLTIINFLKVVFCSNEYIREVDPTKTICIIGYCLIKY